MKKERRPELEETGRMEKFYKSLNFEISSSILYFATWIAPLLLPLLFLAATIYTPYLIYVLYLEKKKMWIISFIILVVAPIVFIVPFFPFLTVVALVPFYLFCFVLRIEVRDWLHEKRAKNELIIKKQQMKNRSNEFIDIFDIRN